MLVYVVKDCLVKALQLVLRAVSANSPYPILTGISIQALPEELIVTGSSSSMSIQYKIHQGDRGVTVRRSGAIVVPARYFYDIIRRCTDEWIGLEMLEGLKLTITSGKSHISLCGMDASEFPPIRGAEGSAFLTSFSIPAELLSESVRQVFPSVSTSESRPVLSGIYFEWGDKGLHLTATDGVRLASRTIPLEYEGSEGLSAIVPGKNAAEAARLLQDADSSVTIEISGNEICFLAQNLLIQSALIEGAYPVVQSIIPKRYLSEAITETAAFLHAVERAAVLAGEGILQLSTAGKALFLLSKTAEIGDVRDEVSLTDRSGENFALALNSRFLLDILRSMKSMFVILRYTGSWSPLIIQPSDAIESAIYLLSPIRTASH